MSTPKYNSGDLVWVRSLGDNAAAGEYRGTIIKIAEAPHCIKGHWAYRIDIEGVPVPAHHQGRAWIACEEYLRPRRDDYQQKEPLGNRADLDKPLKSDLSEETVTRVIDFIS